MLTLPEMITTVTGWVNSCTNERQLATCQDIIDEYVDRRFKNHASPLEIADALDKLQKAVTARKIEVLGIGLEN
jgi:hypothetical protein